jgi:fido (protein-threonine AMPylation protein)
MSTKNGEEEAPEQAVEVSIDSVTPEPQCNHREDVDNQAFIVIPSTLQKMLASKDAMTSSLDESSDHETGPFILHIYILEQLPPGERVRELPQRNDKGKDFMPVILSDTTNTCVAFILHPTRDLKVSKECTISISGYVVGPSKCSAEAMLRMQRLSSQNEEINRVSVDDHKHILYVTDCRIISKENMDQNTNQACEKKQDIETSIPSKFQLPPITSWSFQSGGVANLLAKHNGAALSKHAFSPSNEIAQIISTFLEQHAAIMCIQNIRAKSTGTDFNVFATCHDLAGGSMDIYSNALGEFDRQQQERELNSLDFSTAARWYRTKVAQLKEQFRQTLEYALICKTEALSLQVMIRWHLWLMGDGLDPEAGNLRSRSSVKNGLSMCEPENIQERMQALCDVLETQLLPQIRTAPTDSRKIATFAALSYVGILDILPFGEGNGLLAKITVNWALRRCDFPCCIILYESDTDERVLKLVMDEVMLRSLCLRPFGEVDDGDIDDLLRHTGGLSPLVDFLIGRMAHALNDLTVIVKERAKWFIEEKNARIAREARETAADSLCIVCLEYTPNISTLCCGKPIHFNCMAQWLQSNKSCPQCRADLPLLSTTSNANTVDRPSARNLEGEDSEVERLLNYISHESLDSSSSDSSSSSSSSDSSSDDSSFGIDYDYSANFVSSDDESDDDNGEDDGSSYRLESDSDDESEDQHFFNAALASVEDVGLSWDRFVVEDDTGIASACPANNSGDIRPSFSFRLPEALCDNDSDTFGSENDSSIHRRLIGGRLPINVASTIPRLSFLDPDLLDNVQSGEFLRDGVAHPAFVDSSSTGEEDDSSHPAFARPLGNRIVTLENFSRDVASPFEGAMGHWFAAGAFSSSDGYSSEEAYDFGIEAHPFPPQVRPAVCIQPRCQNHAPADCCSSRCYSCCVKRGEDCPAHCCFITSIPLSSHPLDTASDRTIS